MPAVADTTINPTNISNDNNNNRRELYQHRAVQHGSGDNYVNPWEEVGQRAPWEPTGDEPGEPGLKTVYLDNTQEILKGFNYEDEEDNIISNYNFPTWNLEQDNNEIIQRVKKDVLPHCESRRDTLVQMEDAVISH